MDEAINTRHAGSTALELDKLRGGTLLVQLLNMWLAPVPYVVVLRTTSALLRGNARRATVDERARRSREASREGTPRRARARRGRRPGARPPATRPTICWSASATAARGAGGAGRRGAAARRATRGGTTSAAGSCRARS